MVRIKVFQKKPVAKRYAFCSHYKTDKLKSMPFDKYTAINLKWQPGVSSQIKNIGKCINLQFVDKKLTYYWKKCSLTTCYCLKELIQENISKSNQYIILNKNMANGNYS